MCGRTCTYFLLAILAWSVSANLTKRDRTPLPLAAIHHNPLFNGIKTKGGTLTETLTNTTFATRHGMGETERKRQISGTAKSGGESAAIHRTAEHLAGVVTDLNARRKRWGLFALFLRYFGLFDISLHVSFCMISSSILVLCFQVLNTYFVSLFLSLSDFSFIFYPFWGEFSVIRVTFYLLSNKIHVLFSLAQGKIQILLKNSKCL